MKLQPFQTLKHYDKKIFRRISLRNHYHGSFHSDFHGICADRGSFRQFTDCMVRCSRSFYSDYFPRHHSLFLVWMQLRLHWSDLPSSDLGSKAERKRPAAAVPVLTFCGTVASGILFYEGRKTGKFYLAPVMGGFITGICTTIILMRCKADGWNGRSRRTF